MPFIETKLAGVIIFEPQKYEDERGYFFESYNRKLFADNGIKTNFVQDNQSFSNYGVLRGIHFQTGIFAQAKLVRVITGSVLDVAVDLRAKSQTFGQYIAVTLSAKNMKQLFIPRGFGHGFIVLSETAEFFYKCDNYYSKNYEGGIYYNDSDLKIDWKISNESIIISEKDKTLEPFKQQVFV